jgi:hypothetical protein
VAEAKEASVEAEATGLTPKTQYTFCLVSSNLFGAVPGNEVTLTTIAGPPSITEQSVVAQTTTTAQVSAMINPLGCGNDMQG